MKTKTWKVYGATGHRQRVSFEKSSKYDFSVENNKRVIEVACEDVTGTNDYVIVKVTRNTDHDCVDEFKGQVSDGIFENCRVGKIEEISNAEWEKYKEKFDKMHKEFRLSQPTYWLHK